MANGYLRRLDVGYPQRPNARAIYATRYFEESDPEVLETTVNDFLFALPNAAQRWTPHLVSTQFGYYGTGGGARHTCWLTLFAAGTINASPNGATP